MFLKVCRIAEVFVIYEYDVNTILVGVVGALVL